MKVRLTEPQCQGLLSLYSERDFPMKSREAVRLRLVDGLSYEQAERCSGVSKRNIHRGARKLERAHKVMMAVYGTQTNGQR
ncbi:hypothetical protein GCM10007938_40050 [Vibrio zhanjiangensis]|uniref:RNA polymerase sigma factor 70 region 4 type 2 domain-containing protein n=1 Tax=Vibrio zhanjiangensis TaxID=1046128 RepID=A0ABQ6F4N2_9VIBR|nr:hypothetical protein [Vibrio zhanjiangensis]GLT20222.1 hypothetical protein GCM10007938_40050 [Vibrio zhanjiangensis]